VSKGVRYRHYIAECIPGGLRSLKGDPTIIYRWNEYSVIIVADCEPFPRSVAIEVTFKSLGDPQTLPRVLTLKPTPQPLQKGTLTPLNLSNLMSIPFVDPVRRSIWERCPAPIHVGYIAFTKRFQSPPNHPNFRISKLGACRCNVLSTILS
jgi:hypothetical protein